MVLTFIPLDIVSASDADLDPDRVADLGCVDPDPNFDKKNGSDPNLKKYTGSDPTIEKKNNYQDQS